MKAARARRTRAFTLIEILIVLAIVAILAAILFPVFARVREAGRRASCASNVRQILIGVRLYAQDNDDRAPNTFGGKCAQVPLLHYVRDPRTFTCPSRPERVLDEQCGKTTPTSWHNGTYSVLFSELRLSSVRNPNFIFVLDGNGSGTNNMYRYASVTPELLQGSSGYGVPLHDDGRICGFLDGHAKWMKETALSDRALWYYGPRVPPPDR